MTVWLVNYHKWPSSLSLMLMLLLAYTGIFLASFYFEKLWTRDIHHPGFPSFPGSEGPYTLTLRAPTSPALFLGLLQPCRALCTSLLAPAWPFSPLCLCLLFSHAAAYPVAHFPCSAVLPSNRLLVFYVLPLSLSLSQRSFAPAPQLT